MAFITRSETVTLLLHLCFFSLFSLSLAASPSGYGSEKIHPSCKSTQYQASTFQLEPISLKLLQLVRVDVSARNPGKIQAALTENRRALSELVLEPMKDEYYYEIREPFSIMSIVKSPMGMMMGFMVIMVFLMPKLMENIDPEEMKRTQEEMRNQGIPSLASLLLGTQRSS